jgi:hypothetical protein
MPDRRRLLALAWLAAAVCAPREARAQEAGAENINAATANPERYLYQSGVCKNCVATDVTENPRAQNLNPEGVNFADCTDNLRMDFSLTLSGFTAEDDVHVEAWAGTIDCTQPTNRVLNAGVAHPCWQVGAPSSAMTVTASMTITWPVYARDVLRYENPPADPTALQSYDPTYNYGANGSQACIAQTSDAAVPLSIFFIAVDSNGITQGTAYQYAFTADTVAPPPPSVPAPQPGDTLLTVNWTSPGTDPDLVGYAIYSDPPSSTSAASSGCGCGQAPGSAASSYVAVDAESPEDSGSVMQCPDSSTTTPQDDSSTAGAGETSTTDAAIEASVEDGAIEASTPDAATEARDAGSTKCTPVNQGGSSGSTACASTHLSGAYSFVVGSATTPISTDAGDDGGEGGVEVALSGGGISEVSPTYLAGEVDSNTATSIQLTGLTNGVKYKVAVASLDGSGNVGPLSSPLVCGVAGAVNDFWQTYRDDGGSSAGCALDSAGGDLQTGSVLGLGMFASAAALMRRRAGRNGRTRRSSR